MEEIIDFFNKAHTFYIATVEDDQPRVRPFGGLLLHNGNLYFNTNSTKKVYNQIIKNPKGELCAFHAGTWIRVEGTAVRKTTNKLKKVMFEAQPSVAKMYKGREDIFEVLKLENIKAIKYSFTGEELIL